MRQQADKEGDETLKFISYSNVDANKAKLSHDGMSPKNRTSPRDFANLNSGPGSGDLPGRDVNMDN